MKLLLTFDELAAALGVDRATVYRLKARGELPLPILHVGNSPRVRVVDVEAWLQQLADEVAIADRPTVLPARRRRPA